MINFSFLKGYLTGLLLGAFGAFFLLLKASTTPELSLDNFSFTDLRGNPVDRNTLHGKAVVINIWATWCPPCIREMPSIENARRILNNDNVIFIIASDESVGRILIFKMRRKLELPFYKFSFAANGITEARPQTYIFNKKGELVYNRIGAFEWDDEKILERLRSYLE